MNPSPFVPQAAQNLKRAQEVAPIHGNDGTGHVSRRIRRQEQERTVEIARFSQPTLGDTPDHRLSGPAFEAEYSGTPPTARRPRMEAMLMMHPPCPCATIRRAASWATNQAPFRLVSITRSQSISSWSKNGLVTTTPALLTRVVSPPSSASALATASRTLEASVTSRGMEMARLPRRPISAAVSASLSADRAASATEAPARPRVWAKCRPRPLDAPVTRIFRPSSLNRSPIGNSHHQATPRRQLDTPKGYPATGQSGVPGCQIAGLPDCQPWSWWWICRVRSQSWIPATHLAYS